MCWRLKSFDWFLWQIVLFACIWGLPKNAIHVADTRVYLFATVGIILKFLTGVSAFRNPFFSYTVVWESSLNIFQFCVKWNICFGNLHIGIVSENYSFFFFIYLNLWSRNKRLRGTLSILSKKLFTKKIPHTRNRGVYN